MKVYGTSDLRNVVLIGHGDAGKTSLTSALLLASGAVKRFGSVDDGGSITDYDDEEIARKVSLQAALAHAEWKGAKINIIDTPGYAAFVADAKLGVSVADAALSVVDAHAGVQVITERTFEYASAAGVPVLFVVNKLDRENSPFDETVAAIQERFGRTAVPIHLPIGAGEDFSGVVDLVAMKAWTGGGEGKAAAAPIPDDMADRAAEAHNALVEMVAETDDALMEAFFESGDLTEEQLRPALRAAIASRAVFPIACAAATRGIGAQTLLDAIVGLTPAPDTRGEVQGTDKDGNEVSRPVSDDAPHSLFVFKTVADPFAGKLSLFRVWSGVVKGDSPMLNVRAEVNERLGTLSIAQGKHVESVQQLHAGDIGVVAKLKETQTSDTLCDPGHVIEYPRVTFREPAISYAVEPKSKGDEEKISNALSRLMEEDPVLRVKRDPQTHELLVSGTGQAHVEVTLSKMKRKFGVEAILHPPKVPYLETIRGKASGIEGKHKKQSGGRGQFGVCVIDLEPLPQGSGIEFVDKIFGGSIPQNYRPAVDKGIREAAERGWRAGCPVTDFRITLTDGKYHNVDSSEMAFKIAGSLAFQEAMRKARPTILEPVMQVEITAPEDCMGDIMGDLSSRRGRPQGMEAQGAMQLIKAQVPLAEMLEYASTLKAITSDRGSYHMEFDHYDEVPAQQQDKIVAAYEASKGEKAG